MVSRFIITSHFAAPQTNNRLSANCLLCTVQLLDVADFASEKSISYPTFLNSVRVNGVNLSHVCAKEKGN